MKPWESRLQLIGAIMGTIILWMVFERLEQKRLAILAAAAVVAIAIPQWWNGERSAEFHMKQLASEVETAFPDAVFVGGWSDALALWTDLDTPNRVGPLPPTAVLVEEAEAFDQSSRAQWLEFRRLRLESIGRTLVVAQRRQ